MWYRLILWGVIGLLFLVGCKGQSSSVSGPPIPSNILTQPNLGYGLAEAWHLVSVDEQAQALRASGLTLTVIELSPRSQGFVSLGTSTSFLRTMQQAGITTHIHVWNANCLTQGICPPATDVVSYLETLEQRLGGWGNITLEVAEVWVNPGWGNSTQVAVRSRFPAQYRMDYHPCRFNLDQWPRGGLIVTDCSDTNVENAAEVGQWARQNLSTDVILYDYQSRSMRYDILRALEHKIL